MTDGSGTYVTAKRYVLGIKTPISTSHNSTRKKHPTYYTKYISKFAAIGQLF